MAKFWFSKTQIINADGSTLDANGFPFKSSAGIQFSATGINIDDDGTDLRINVPGTNDTIYFAVNGVDEYKVDKNGGSNVT